MPPVAEQRPGRERRAAAESGGQPIPVPRLHQIIYRQLVLRERATFVIALTLAAVLAGCAGSGGEESRVLPPGGGSAYSPYVDVALTSPFDLAGVAPGAGVRSLTLAFVTADGECNPSWGGRQAIDAASVAGPAARLRAAGVALRVSFGGVQGTELAQSCPTASRLEAAYASVLNRYRAVAADFDLENATLADRTTLIRRGEAIAQLQARMGRPLAISLTLPVSPHGLSSAALGAVRSMLAAGVRLHTINLLTMNYGGAFHGGMGAAAIGALLSAHRQLSGLGGGLDGWSALGVTAMVGVNEVSGEVFTLSDARMLAGFAARHDLGLTSIWSLARDNPCQGSESSADPTCSGVREPPYAFSRVFGARPVTGLLPRRAVDTS